MRIVDLFAGCGGFSQGFRDAGFHSVLAIEMDLWAAETFAANHTETKVITQDIRNVDPCRLDLSEVDGVIGGPPCQGFSLSGNRDPKDPRNSLFMEFVRFVRELQPKFFVMENVLGLLSMVTRDRRLVSEIIREEFVSAGYRLMYSVLNAADFGVPQSRQRVFFIGLRADLPFNGILLNPSNTRMTKVLVSLEEAISDLPALNAGDGEEFQSYPSSPENAYQRAMRQGASGIWNHVAMRHTPRIIERFKQIGYGQSVKDVSSEHSQRKRGDAGRISGKVFSQNNMRPFPDRPCPTVAASFQSNFIHPYLNRNFTAREGARIQSFPDRYVFKGKRTTMSWEKHLSQYQQIGNAVPPLLAEAIGIHIKRYLECLNEIQDLYSEEPIQGSLFA
jgi:DNA (cytosine-5)-methyltransferase 1